MTRLLFLFTCGEEESNASGKRTQPGVKMWRTRVTLTHSPFTFTLPFVGGWVCVEGRRWGEGVRWGVGGGRRKTVLLLFPSRIALLRPDERFFFSLVYITICFFFSLIFLLLHPPPFLPLLRHNRYIRSYYIMSHGSRVELSVSQLCAPIWRFLNFFSCRFFAEVNESSGKRQILRVTKLSAVFFFKKKGRFLR